MAINAGQAVGYLDLDFSGFSRGLRTAQSQLRAFNDTSMSTTDRFNSVGQGLKAIGSSMSKYVSVPLMAAGAASTKTAIDFESAFAGVRKTVDTTEKELSKLEKGIRGLAKEMPTAATEIAGVAEAAGQLGIEVPNILSFTKTMVMLGDSTNMSAEEAATSLARLANITGMSQTDFDRLGSTIVALGNNLATTEQEITAMGLRLAGAGSQIGMSEAQILSFAGALSSVGIEAEAGGSAFSKVMIDMQLATEKGGEKLNNFAKVAGMSAKEFKNAFEEDASKAIMKFIEGLGSAEERGLSAIGILDDMGIKEVRLRDSLLRAAGASDVFSDALAIGTEAWEENNALTKEAEQRYETTQSKLLILKNKLIDVGITIGNALIPRLEKMVDWLGKAAEWFSKLDPTIQNVLIGVGSFVAAIGPALMIIGQMSIGISALIKFSGKAKTALIALGTSLKTKLLAYIISFNTFLHASLIPTLTATAFSVGAVTVPVWAVIAAIAALVGIGYVLIKNWDQIKETAGKVWEGLKKTVTDTWNNLKKSTEESWNNMKESLGNTWNNMKASTEKTWDDLGQYFSNTWTNLKNQFSSWGDSIGQALDNAWNFCKKSAENAWNSIGDFFTETIPAMLDQVSGWFSNLPYKIGYALGYAAGTIFKWGAGIWIYLSTNVPIWINAVGTFFSELPGKIWTWLLDCINKVVQWGTEVYTRLVYVVNKTINQIVTFYSELPGKIWTWLTECINKMVQWGTDTYNTAVQYMTQTINKIMEEVSQWPGKIWNWLVQCVNKVKQWGTETYNNAVNYMSRTINGIIQYISQLPGRVWTWLSNTVNRVIQWGSQMISQGRQAASNTLNAIVSTISGLPSKLMNIGSDAVRALWNGISSLYGWLKSKVKGFLRGITDGFRGFIDGVKDAVGFSLTPEDEVVEHQVRHQFYNLEDLSKVKFNLSKARQTSRSDQIAQAVKIKDMFSDLDGTGPGSKSESGNRQTENTYNINLNIDKMVNTEDKSIEEIADELAFYLKRRGIV